MGRIGAKPQMIPVNLSVVTPEGEKKYSMEMISDPKLTPILVGIVAFNGLTQNTTYGEGTTLRLSGSINIAGHSGVAIDNMYAPTESSCPMAPPSPLPCNSCSRGSFLILTRPRKLTVFPCASRACPSAVSRPSKTPGRN